MKKWLLPGVALLLCLALCAACAGGGASAANTGGSSSGGSSSSVSQSSSSQELPQGGIQSGGQIVDRPDPHLGTWYCEALDQDLELKWDGTYVFGEDISNDDTAQWYVGHYQLDGDAAQLDSGERFDYYAIDDTMRYGTYIFARVEYTGDRHPLPDDLVFADSYDWSNPATDKEAMAQEVISVWQQYGESFDAKWSDPATLVEGIDEYIGETDLVFTAACVAAAIDPQNYRLLF